jgi:hypothetical protein
MNRMIFPVLLTAVVMIGMTGCRQEAESVFLPVPPAIPGGPELGSVPDDATRVAVMSGTGSFEVPIHEGQRWFLVDEKADQLIKSGVSDRDGTLKVGEDGAHINNQQVWDGSTENVDNLALYLMSRREQV